MKSFYQLAFLALILLAGSCKDDAPEIDCELSIADGTRFYEFAHRGTDHTFYAWTSDTAVIAKVEAQLALPEEQRLQHINGQIAALPEGCDWNNDWSWYFTPNEWDLADISIELCDGNPQYVEDNLQDYLDIDRYCPWSSYVLQEVSQPF
jgi:hypothetical protein